jgi:hypothetical protein
MARGKQNVCLLDLLLELGDLAKRLILDKTHDHMPDLVSLTPGSGVGGQFKARVSK